MRRSLILLLLSAGCTAREPSLERSEAAAQADISSGSAAMKFEDPGNGCDSILREGGWGVDGVDGPFWATGRVARIEYYGNARRFLFVDARDPTGEPAWDFPVRVTMVCDNPVVERRTAAGTEIVSVEVIGVGDTITVLTTPTHTNGNVPGFRIRVTH